MEEGPESIWRDVGDLYPLDASDDKPCRNALLVSDSLSKYEKSLQWIEHFFGSEFLKQQCKFAFDSIDTDKSNSIDSKELYVAVLLLYLQLGKVLRGLTPPTQESLVLLMKKVDLDEEESLSLDEFQAVISILLGNIATRVLFQLGFQLLLVPFLSAYIMSCCATYYPIPDVIPPSVPPAILSSLIIAIVVPAVLQHVDIFFSKTEQNLENESSPLLRKKSD